MADDEHNDQREVIAFLSEGLPEGVAERIDTSISLVFLTRGRAYKLKRAVRFPFLDFSTRERRRAACEAEVEINRRTAPDLYLGVCAVTRRPDGGLEIDGDGAALDWLVVMRRFDEACVLARMAERGALQEGHILDLAEEIARFHERAEVRPDRGGGAGIAWVIDSNTEMLRASTPGLFEPALIEALDRRARASLARLAPLLDARREAGRVLRCHGDLHLRNVCLIEGRPTLFDAIEFNDDVACIDAFYDIAFLLMDLWQRGYQQLANTALNRWLERTGDVEGLAALPLFLSCRAAVRAHVSAVTATAEAGRGAAQVRRREARARHYLDLALGFLDPPPPRLVAVGGLSGVGKSTLARGLAPALGAPPGAVLLRSDVIRKRLAGVDPLERLDEGAYSAAMTKRVYKEIGARAGAVLSAGHAAIADAVFARPGERREIAGVAAAAKVDFAGLWLEAPAEVLEHRVDVRTEDASDATVGVLRRQLTYDVGAIDWRRLDAAAPAATVRERALAGLDAGGSTKDHAS